MAFLEIKDLSKTFGNVEVLHDINLEVEAGEFIVLVGPSGCGKSTLLNLIAGLERPTYGSIHLGGRAIDLVHPKDRDIAMVFQSYALYPSMTVKKNITFGLQVRKVDKAIQERAVAAVAELLQIEQLIDRKPSQLSGGQRQRVAMARALVRDPQVFLFDEPLSNLDAKLRIEMRTEIKKLHARLGRTMIYVTHDQVEALTLADRVVLLKDGYLQQIDTPQKIYDAPHNTFIASFIGSPPMNLFPGKVVNCPQQSNELKIEIDGDDGVIIPLPDGLAPDNNLVDRPVLVGIRPEHIQYLPDQANGGASGLVTPVTVVEPTGADTMVFFRLAGTDAVVRVEPHIAPQPGTQATFRLDPARSVLFDRESGSRL